MDDEHTFPNLSKGRRGDGTKADKHEQTAAKKPRVTTSEGPTDAGGEEQDETAMEYQMACETNSEGQTRNTLQKLDETSHLNELMPDAAENKETRNRGQHEEDEVQAGRDEASRHQGGGEEGHGRREPVKRLIDEEPPRSWITQGHTYGTFEEPEEAKADDAPANVGEQPEKSRERRPHDEPEPQDQRATADLTCGMGRHWGEATGLEELRGDAGRVRQTDENTKMGDEEEGERRIDSKNEMFGLDTGGEMVKIDVSVGERSREGTGDDWGTLSEVKSSGDAEKQTSLPAYGDAQYFSTTEMKDDAALRENTYYIEQHLDQKRRTHDWTQRVKLPHYGLYNQGATCYLNSVLQVLSMTTEMHDRLDSKLETDQELRKLFKGLKEHPCRTEDIASSLKIGNVSEQRDAAECLELILHKISPQASKVFHGELAYNTKCSKDHIINEEANEFWTLPLSLEDVCGATYSVERSMESFFLTKSITGSCKVYCNDCDDETDATSSCEMVEHPQILTLLLKRFDYDDYTMTYVKLGCCVEVPSLLQLKDKKYRLYGMVNHSGSLRGGHYTATILSSKDNSWYEFDDTRVVKVKNPFAASITYNSRTVYLLMYRATESQETIDTKQSGDETRTLHQPTEELPKSRESSVVLFLIVFCCVLWLGAVICAITSFLTL
ncbi:uncharacterized protein LOC143317158 [Chaetodon auriga]|uniref:uncharacterized protein LOC143317158 n=1 Tax=Chaetodon auriga TaxID=39042 RepID=UPI004032EE5F